MFTSIIDSSVVSEISISSTLLCMVTALVLGIVIATTYQWGSERYTKNFVITLALLPALVMAVILMTSGSLGTAVAVLGTFSLVRFRSVQGTSREILGIFFAMATGLACGMGQLLFAAMFTVIVAAAYLTLMRSPFGKETEKKLLRVMIPEDLDYTQIFDDLFQTYTDSASLVRVKTVNLGSMYEMDYHITLKDEKREKEFLDEIRTRNGNLTVICGRVAESVQEL